MDGLDKLTKLLWHLCGLCRAAYEDLEADEGASLANWYERVQKAGQASTLAAAALG